MSGVTNEETGSRECMFEVNYKPTDRSPMQSWKSAHPSHMSYVSVSSQSLLKWAPTSHIRWHRTLKNHSVVVVLPLIHRWLTKSSARGQQNQHFHHCQACWRLLDNLLLIISSVATVLQWLFWHHSTYIAANHSHCGDANQTWALFHRWMQKHLKDYPPPSLVNCMVNRPQHYGMYLYNRLEFNAADRLWVRLGRMKASRWQIWGKVCATYQWLKCLVSPL